MKIQGKPFVDRPPAGYRWGLQHEGEPVIVRMCAACEAGPLVPFTKCPCHFFDRRALFHFSSPYLSRQGIEHVLVESRTLLVGDETIRAVLAQPRPRLDNPYALPDRMWAYYDALKPLTLRASVLWALADARRSTVP